MFRVSRASVSPLPRELYRLCLPPEERKEKQKQPEGADFFFPATLAAVSPHSPGVVPPLSFPYSSNRGPGECQ